MRIYETMFIIKPDVPEQQREQLVEGVRKFVEERLKSKVETVDRWGMKKLAYKIGRYFDGDYTVMYFRSNGQGLDQLENYFKVHPEFMRWQTFRREDLEKKERKAAREKKAEEAVTSEGTPSEAPVTDVGVNTNDEKVE